MSKARNKFKRLTYSPHKKKTYRNPYNFSREVKMEILVRDKGKCIFCGKTETEEERLSYAHLIPKSSGGMGVAQNGFLACGVDENGKLIKGSCHDKCDTTAERKWMIPHAENYLRDHYNDWDYNKYIKRTTKNKMKKGLV